MYEKFTTFSLVAQQPDKSRVENRVKRVRKMNYGCGSESPGRDIPPVSSERICPHQKTEGKSQATVDYYQGNLRRFIWYTNQQNWPDDIRLLNEWQCCNIVSGNDSKKERFRKHLGL